MLRQRETTRKYSIWARVSKVSQQFFGRTGSDVEQKVRRHAKGTVGRDWQVGSRKFQFSGFKRVVRWESRKA